MKKYHVENFGEVGEANLLHGVIETQGTAYYLLEVGQSTLVRIQGDRKYIHKGGHTSDRKRQKETPFVRVTRTA